VYFTFIWYIFTRFGILCQENLATLLGGHFFALSFRACFCKLQLLQRFFGSHDEEDDQIPFELEKIRALEFQPQAQNLTKRHHGAISKNTTTTRM
jgi:hypothetical protein